MKKFIEFYTTDDYMEKVINRYKSIKEAREQRYQKEQEADERALYEKLKQKYEHLLLQKNKRKSHKDIIS